LLGTIWLLVWAICSLITWGFYHWIDLRLGGAALEIGLPVLWTLSLAAYARLRIPSLAGNATPNKRSPTAALPPLRVLSLLLMPTLLMLLCLLFNTVYYYRLLAVGTWGGTQVPITVIMAGLLGGWLILAWRDALSGGKNAGRASGGKKRRPTQSAGKLPLVAAVWTLASVLAGVWFFHMQFRANPPPPGTVVDVAVVLGNGVTADGQPSPILADRVAGAVELFRQGRVRHLLMSGAMEHFPSGTQSEADVMKAHAVRLGVPASRILLDAGGFNTRATAANTVALMKLRRWTTVVGVSDDSHLPRVQLALAQEGAPTAYTYPCRHDLWPAADPLWIARETVGILVYRFSAKYRRPEDAPMTVTEPRIIVYKRPGKLELYDGPRLAKTYPCSTGKKPGDKGVEGDRKTPEGLFHIVVKNPKSQFHLSLGLDYPNEAIAARALEIKAITREEYDRILTGLKTTGIPDWKTALGGEIFLHGNGTGRTGTAGCVALSNEDIEELYGIGEVGTVVEIRP
ncbi:MAG: ElyC/SanA/YdcF family protein, partial [Phycisphaerae bacterium]